MMCARLFCKGAAELLLDKCDTWMRSDSSVAYLTDAEKSALLASFGSDGHRCVGKGLVPSLVSRERRGAVLISLKICRLTWFDAFRLSFVLVGAGIWRFSPQVLSV